MSRRMLARVFAPEYPTRLYSPRIRTEFQHSILTIYVTRLSLRVRQYSRATNAAIPATFLCLHFLCFCSLEKWNKLAFRVTLKWNKACKLLVFWPKKPERKKNSKCRIQRLSLPINWRQSEFVVSVWHKTSRWPISIPPKIERIYAPHCLYKWCLAFL